MCVGFVISFFLPQEETTTPASGKSENEISVIRDTPEEEGNCKLFCNGELDKDHISGQYILMRNCMTATV